MQTFEGASLRSGHAPFALAVTCVETSATLTVVLVRMGNAYAGYRVARSTVRHDENFNPDTDLHVKLLRCWMLMFEAIGLLLFAFSLTCLLVFHFHYHVGWTILSNNISMITILALSTLYSARVISTVSRIREDQYKVYISKWDSSMLRNWMGHNSKDNSIQSFNTGLCPNLT